MSRIENQIGFTGRKQSDAYRRVNLFCPTARIWRARCGNRLSFTPQQPAALEKEIPEEAFNKPEAPTVTIPFDAPPVTEAELYVPAPPLLVNLLSPRPLPAFPVSASQPVASAPPGGAYGPVQMSPSGYYIGGVSFFRNNELPARSGAATSGTSSAVPVIIGAPESSTAGLLLLSGFILLLSSFRPGVSGKNSYCRTLHK